MTDTLEGWKPMGNAKYADFCKEDGTAMKKDVWTITALQYVTHKVVFDTEVDKSEAWIGFTTSDYADIIDTYEGDVFDIMEVV